MTRWLVALLVLLGLAGPASAVALQLDIQLHDVADDRRSALEKLTRESVRAVEADLQMPLEGTLHVDYAGTPEAFRKVLDAHGAQGWPENWISGLALLDQDRIIVQVNGPGALHTSETVRHEMAHIAIHAMSQGVWLPRWYHEGVAMFLAGEATFERMREQAGAAAFGELQDLGRLDRGFGNDDQVAAERAYAVSAGFVRFAVSRAREPSAILNLHARMRQGLDFDAAWTATFGLRPEALYSLYGAYIGQHASRWSLVLTDGVLWGVVSLLSVVVMLRAWLRRPTFEPEPDDEPLDLEAIALAGELAVRPWRRRDFTEVPLQVEPDADPEPQPEQTAEAATETPTFH